MKTRSLRHWASMKVIHDQSKNRVKHAVDAADELDLSKLFLGHKFAHGAQSKLYHGTYNDESVAVKITRVPEPNDDETRTGALTALLEKQFDREVIFLSRLHHSNVVKFIGASRKPPVYCLVTEYLPQGSLRAYLHKLEVDDKSVPLEKLIAFALDIARGMEYIHSQGVIHPDLKPENVLIDQDFGLKIADFGIACEEEACDSLTGTYRWMAPEMIKRNKSYGRKVDVYSFGLLVWEMLAGTIPFRDMNPLQVAFAVSDKDMRPAIPKDCPAAMRTLTEQCWSLHSEKRPEFSQIVKLLEQFESSLTLDGTLNHVHTPKKTCHDHKKKKTLGPAHPHIPTPMPKFS